MKKILVKLSGEMLSIPGEFGVDYNRVKETAAKLAALRAEGYSLAIVIGGGNIFRGVDLKGSGMAKTPADQIGMLSTLINGVALKTALEQIGISSRLISALECPKVAETFQYDLVMGALEAGELVIFVGGTGNPYFTTDTCAALRACEMEADLLVKATKVDGVYDQDPKKGEAKKFSHLTHSDFIKRELKVMDLTAVALCKNQNIPIFVMNMADLGVQSLQNIIKNHQGTFIKG